MKYKTLPELNPVQWDGLQWVVMDITGRRYFESDDKALAKAKYAELKKEFGQINARMRKEGIVEGTLTLAQTEYLRQSFLYNR
jgi:hypothetical protein